jgi:hypothetical protein
MMSITKQKLKFIPDKAQVVEVRAYPSCHEFLHNPDSTIRIYRSEGQYWVGDQEPFELRIYASEFFDGNFLVVKFKNSYTGLHNDVHQNFYRVRATKDSDGLVTDLLFQEMYFDLCEVGAGLPSD